MRPVSDLEKFHSAVVDRINKIRRIYASHRGSTQRPGPRDFAFCVIELDNLIINALREYAVSSLRSARTKKGKRITSTCIYTSHEEIGAVYLSLINNQKFVRLGSPRVISRRDEPSWRDPKNIEKLLAYYSTSNFSSFQTALSLNSAVFRDIALFRNFYAHRCSDTWHKCKRWLSQNNFKSMTHPDEFVGTAVHTVSVQKYEDWLSDLELFFDCCTD
jgi:hypothetical protein